MQQKNYKKPYTQPLLGYETIYTEQTMQVKVPKILLSLSTLMRSPLLIFQILWSSTQSMKNKTIFTSNNANLFLHRVILSFWVSNFINRVTYSAKASSKNIGFFWMQRNYFSWFSTLIQSINHLSMLYWAKKSQTFCTPSRYQLSSTVKV